MFDDQVTVLVPTSPIPRHPDTSLIEECLGAIRHSFPTARIIIMADGVRPQIEYRRRQYEAYLRELPVKLDENMELMLYPEFQHQARMTQRTLEHVSTPLILFVEHDAMLRTSPAIEWPVIFDLILSGEANVVRMYNWEKATWPEHDYLMRGDIVKDGVRFVRTVQYSGWPFISSADYHRRLLARYLRPGQRGMIESVVYGPVANAAWEENKIVVYAPANAHTFVHRDGRTDEQTGRRDPADW